MILYKKLKKYNEIQLTKNEMDLHIRKMTNHPLSPRPKHKWLDYLLAEKMRQLYTPLVTTLSDSTLWQHWHTARLQHGDVNVVKTQTLVPEKTSLSQ